MQRRRAPKGNHGSLRNFLAALRTMDAGGIRHVLVDHFANSRSSFHVATTKLYADASSDSCGGGVPIETELTMCEPRWVDTSENEIRISDGGHASATAITNRTGVRACAFRSNSNDAQLVDMSDRPSSGAYFYHLDNGNLDRYAASFLIAVLP